MRREDRKRHASCVSGEVCASSVIRKRKKLKKTLDTAGVVRDGRLHAQGRSIREIADELGYSRSLVHKTLANGESRRVANAAS